MPRYRTALPQLGGGLFLTDGGLETTLIYHQGWELPDFGPLLNAAPELDSGNPTELGNEYAALRRRLGKLNVLGGGCGTDHRHLEQIAAACAPPFRSATEQAPFAGA
jgi:S-methylmethionine-dependent homocysteine/selenocysteine methylase